MSETLNKQGTSGASDKVCTTLMNTFWDGNISSSLMDL
jgi:hypothetical protein